MTDALVVKQTHGVPALLSFFFPGLGQIVKGHWGRAFMFWILLALPWIGYGVLLGLTIPKDTGADVLAAGFLVGTIIPGVLNFPICWQLVDAYRR